jgi:uncharacterized membrane protein
LPIALAAVAFALLISIFSFFLSFFVAALAMIVSGIALAVLGVVALLVQPVEGIMLLGVGLICLSLGMALSIGTVKLCQLTIKGITWIFAKILGKRRGGHPVDSNPISHYEPAQPTQASTTYQAASHTYEGGQQ